jgi:hypothetical protein
VTESFGQNSAGPQPPVTPLWKIVSTNGYLPSEEGTSEKLLPTWRSQDFAGELDSVSTNEASQCAAGRVPGFDAENR